MFGAFRATLASCGGLLWKNPARMSKTRKANVRKRLKAVDKVIETVIDSGVKLRALEVAIKDTPKESTMQPRDKYTVFSRKHKKYRKSFHKVPKFTKVTMRITPEGF
ncbi:7827_t:CDS:2 [Ambispora leptoticha]|uniref:7827_t:CDS:1 n=1 Tax=Ambispora leptoticha TaxID=144679 RepID=A0A9N9G6W8_9GLOM|nr:7827_t:CDS:2 [Ambispora leptoticha]